MVRSQAPQTSRSGHAHAAHGAKRDSSSRVPKPSGISREIGDSVGWLEGGSAHRVPRSDQPRSGESRLAPVSPLAQLLQQSQVRTGENNRMLVTITVLGSPGPLKVVVDSSASVRDVIRLALVAYDRERRLPSLPIVSTRFDLYCGYDASEPLDGALRIGRLGVRHFLMCKKVEEEAQEFKQSEQSNVASWLTKFLVSAVSSVFVDIVECKRPNWVFGGFSVESLEQNAAVIRSI